METHEENKITEVSDRWLTEKICLSIKKTGEKLDVSLEGKNNKRISFNDFLPDGWKIIQGKEKGRAIGRPGWGNSVVERAWTVDRDSKTLFLGEFENQKDILAVLHELGHINVSNLEEENDLQKLGIQASISRKIGDEEDIQKTKYDYEKAFAEIEIKCWKYAEEKLPEIIEKLSLSFADIFADRKDLIDYVNESLVTFTQGIEANPYLEEDDVEKIKNLYLYS